MPEVTTNLSSALVPLGRRALEGMELIRSALRMKSINETADRIAAARSDPSPAEIADLLDRIAQLHPQHRRQTVINAIIAIEEAIGGLRPANYIQRVALPILRAAIPPWPGTASTSDLMSTNGAMTGFDLAVTVFPRAAEVMAQDRQIVTTLESCLTDSRNASQARDALRVLATVKTVNSNLAFRSEARIVDLVERNALDVITANDIDLMVEMAVRLRNFAPLLVAMGTQIIASETANGSERVLSALRVIDTYGTSDLILESEREHALLLVAAQMKSANAKVAELAVGVIERHILAGFEGEALLEALANSALSPRSGVQREARLALDHIAEDGRDPLTRASAVTYLEGVEVLDGIDFGKLGNGGLSATF